jgi:membrane protease YdiL (CAAX protease family)
MSTRVQLIWFFALSFVLAWGSWLPTFLYPGVPRAVAFIGLFAPAISALIVAGVAKGNAGVQEVLGRYKILHFRLRWYISAVVLMPAIYLAAVFFNSTLLGFLPLREVWLKSPAYFVPAAFVWLMFITSGEEIGWRGFALPRLLEVSKAPALPTLLLGAIWAIWHAPIYLVPGQGSIPYPLFFVFTVSLSFVYTILFLHSKGSLWTAVLLHAATDVGPRFLAIAKFNLAVWVTVDVLLIIAALIFWVSWRRRTIAEEAVQEIIRPQTKSIA